MIEDGVITRADVNRAVKNSAKVVVGASLNAVKARFPSIVILPHKYDERGHYLVLATKDRKAAILFEESDGRVTEVRAGLEPSVEYVEGCL